MDLLRATRELSTDALLLRPLTMADAEAMFAVYSDAKTMQYWSNQPVTDLAGAARMLRADVDAAADGKAIFWGITLAGTGALLGKCTLFSFSPGNRRAEVGYILNREYWGRGFMSEAMTAAIDFAFDDLGLHRLEADTDPDNAPSLALLGKLGFREEGRFRERWNVADEWRDSVMLGLLRNEWDERRIAGRPGD